MVAALPTECSDSRIGQLFERGYQRYTVDGEPQPTDLIRDIERFGTAALNDRLRLATARNPLVDDPGILAVVSTLSAVCVKAHPSFEKVPPRNIQVLYDIRELYVNNLASLIREFGDPTAQQDIAEVLYAKEPGEDGPQPGRVCTGIQVIPEFGGGQYLEIPMVAASRQCLMRQRGESGGDAKDDERREGEDAARRPILTRLKDNNLYVPIGDFDEKYREYARGGFKRLLRVQEESLTDDQITWLTTHENGITDRIDSLVNSGHRERIWRNWDVGERLIRVLKKAIDNHPDEDVTVGAFLSAKTLYSAVERYEPERGWERATIGRISSPRSLGNLLARHRDHRLLEIRQRGNTNEYKLIGTSPSGPEPIQVETIEDLFQLPCLANMEERLHRESPVRKDLYNFVRMVLWLPEYRNANPDRVVEDLKTVFARWPWYDEATTDYQVRYEINHTIDGEVPLPMNCSNDDMQRYCIGQDLCPHTVYGSIPFSEEMYSRIEGRNKDEF